MAHLIKPRLYPDPILARVCEPMEAVIKESAQVRTALREVAEAMRRSLPALGGFAMAAPQAGVTYRFFVVDVPSVALAIGLSPAEREEHEARGLLPWFVADPVLTTDPDSQEVGYTEGCLSLPGVRANVRRPDAVLMDYTTVNGDRRVVRLEGILARIAQHEVDHLDGKLLLDRLTGSAQEKAQRLANKLRRL